MASLVVKVRTKLSIYAHQKVRGLLEGEYGSVFKGRSLDFDDLREYVPGDDIKDIDWKATARSGQTLIKRYVAIRKHNILLVVDTGKNMAALGSGGQVKRDVAVMTAGVIGYIAQKHGDLVALVAGDESGSTYIPLKETTIHLERILQHIHTKTSLQSAPSNLKRQLEYIARNIRRRTILIVIADELAIDEQHEQLLRRLKAQHEILWVALGDAILTANELLGDEIYDVANPTTLSAFIRGNKKVQQEFQQARQTQQEATRTLLQRLGISNTHINGEADVAQSLFGLLERQRRAKR